MTTMITYTETVNTQEDLNRKVQLASGRLLMLLPKAYKASVFLSDINVEDSSDEQNSPFVNKNSSSSGSSASAKGVRSVRNNASAKRQKMTIGTGTEKGKKKRPFDTITLAANVQKMTSGTITPVAAKGQKMTTGTGTGTTSVAANLTSNAAPVAAKLMSKRNIRPIDVGSDEEE
jgi:hypothetical protein